MENKIDLKINFIFFLLFFLFSGLVFAKQDYPKSFFDAKKKVRLIFQDMKKTFYCGCSYDNHNKVRLKTCGYKVRKNHKRAKRIEIEHIVPAENFGRGMKSRCWTNPICTKKNGKKYKGRACCLKADKKFKNMHNDLHNLVPAIGEINGDRSNFRFSALDTTDAHYGGCNFKIDFKGRKVEPSNRVKGVVARVYLYFRDTYGMRLSKQQAKLFTTWNNQYPPEQWEVKWNERVFKIQGNYNSYIAK